MQSRQESYRRDGSDDKEKLVKTLTTGLVDLLSGMQQLSRVGKVHSNQSYLEHEGSHSQGINLKDLFHF
jgi:hypothetical protein